MLHKIIDVLIEFGASFKILHFVLLSEGSSLLSRHLSLIFQIDFVSHKHLDYAWVSMLIN